jgi:hypothetical protein
MLSLFSWISEACELNLNAIVNARYANAPAKQKGGDLSNVECYTCHKMETYSNKCPDRQPGTALGTRHEGKPWCSHHQANTHSRRSIGTYVRHLGPFGADASADERTRVADVRRVKENSSPMPGAQRLQVVGIREHPVERSYKKCFRRSCSRRMRPRQARAERFIHWQCFRAEGAVNTNVRH